MSGGSPLAHRLHGFGTTVFAETSALAVGRHLVPFAFCTGDDVLGEAVQRLVRLGRAGG